MKSWKPCRSRSGPYQVEPAGRGGRAGRGGGGGLVPLSKNFQMQFACEMREHNVSEGEWIVDDYAKAS